MRPCPMKLQSAFRIILPWWSMIACVLATNLFVYTTIAYTHPIWRCRRNSDIFTLGENLIITFQYKLCHSSLLTFVMTSLKYPKNPLPFLWHFNLLYGIWTGNHPSRKKYSPFKKKVKPILVKWIICCDII